MKQTVYLKHKTYFPDYVKILAVRFQYTIKQVGQLNIESFYEIRYKYSFDWGLNLITRLDYY